MWKFCEKKEKNTDERTERIFNNFFHDIKYLFEMSVVGSNKVGFNGEVGMKFGSPRWHQVGRLKLLKEKRRREWRREGGFLRWGFLPKNEGDSRIVFERRHGLKKKKKRNTFGLIFSI